jgi:signal transduction histidine kinase
MFGDVILIDRLRSTRLDAALAIAFVAAALVQNAIRPIGDPGLAQLYVLGSTLPLAWRRTLPVESSLCAAAFWLIPLHGFPVLGFVVVILQFFALGAHGSPRIAVGLATAAAAVTGVIGTLLGPEPPVAAVGAVLFVLAPVLAGRLVRHLRAQNDALAALTRELAEERHRVEAAAVEAECARIAQELHDVVGHELTLIAIQAEAAGTALQVRPEKAAEPVEAIRSTAHRTLAEMRAVLEVFAPAEAPATDGVAELSRRAREAGIDNVLEESGTPSPAHAPVSLAVSRIIRECLTNAGRHAPGEPVTLNVDWLADHVLVRSANRTRSRVAGRPGRGLTGMRHRAELLGGTFSASRAEDRFEVSVRLPVVRESR